MAFLGPFLPAIGAASSLLGGITSAFGARGQSQSSLMQDQFQYGMQGFHDQLKYGPSWEMAGLKAAGLHPFLRYGQGGSAMHLAVPQVSAPSQSQVSPFEALGAGIAGAGREAASAYGTASSAERDQTQVAINRVTPARVQAETARTLADTQLRGAQHATELHRAELVFTQAVLAAAQAMLPEAQMAVFASQISLMSEQERLARYQAEVQSHEATIRSNMSTSQELRTLMDRARFEHEFDLFSDSVVGFILTTMREFAAAAAGRR